MASMLRRQRIYRSQQEQLAADVDRFWRLVERIASDDVVTPSEHREVRYFYMAVIKPGLVRLLFSHRIGAHIQNTGHLGVNVKTLLRDFERRLQEMDQEAEKEKAPIALASIEASTDCVGTVARKAG